MDDWKGKKKSSDTMGTFVENPFFLSLLPLQKQEKEKEQQQQNHIQTPLFDGLPVHTIAHLGNYGDSYLPFFPIVLLELPSPVCLGKGGGIEKGEEEGEERGWISGLVSSLRRIETECYVVVHSKPTLGPCQHFICENENEMNLMFHPWLFRGCIFNELFSDIQMVEMGVFGAHGVVPVHQDLAAKHARGVPFDVLEEREVSVHNQCFSPANAQLQIQPNIDLAFFFSVCFSPLFSRQILTLHYVPLSEEKERDFLSIGRESLDFSEFCERFGEEKGGGKKGGEYLSWFLEWVREEKKGKE